MTSSRDLKVAVLALLAIAAVLGLGLVLRGQALDYQAFRWVNTGWASPVFDVLANLGYVLGSFWFNLFVAGLIFLLGYRRIGASLAVATVAVSLSVEGLKLLLNQPRPWQLLPDVRLPGVPAYDAGYPSGHAAQAFLSAFLLSNYFSLPWYGEVGVYALATLVALSRIYQGEHFPVDVIVGGTIGLLAGMLWLRLWPRLVDWAQRRRRH